MGLRETLQGAVAAAFDQSLGDAVEAFTLKKISSQAYDELTGDNVLSYSTEVSRGIFDNFTTSELNSDNIMPTDFKLIVLQNELSLVPSIDDIVLSNSIQYKVISVKRDPANVAWEIQCRA